MEIHFLKLKKNGGVRQWTETTFIEYSGKYHMCKLNCMPPDKGKEHGPTLIKTPNLASRKNSSVPVGPHSFENEILTRDEVCVSWQAGLADVGRRCHRVRDRCRASYIIRSFTDIDDFTFLKASSKCFCPTLSLPFSSPLFCLAISCLRAHREASRTNAERSAPV